MALFPLFFLPILMVKSRVDSIAEKIIIKHFLSFIRAQLLFNFEATKNEEPLNKACSVLQNEVESIREHFGADIEWVILSPKNKVELVLCMPFSPHFVEFLKSELKYYDKHVMFTKKIYEKNVFTKIELHLWSPEKNQKKQ